jgi:hypothetical protein
VSWAKAVPAVNKQMISKRRKKLFFIRFDSALLVFLIPLPWGEPVIASPRPLTPQSDSLLSFTLLENFSFQ